ncbi:hypothetical protein D3C86_1380440 [compost metagenome]
MADGGLAHGGVLKQAFDHLHAHFPVQAVDGLGRGVAKHVEDAFGIAGDGLACFIGIEHNLRAAQDHADDQCRQEHDPEQLHRQAVLEFQLQRVIPCSVRVASSCHEYWQSRDGSQRDNHPWGILPAAWLICSCLDELAYSHCVGCRVLQLEGRGGDIFLLFDVSRLWRWGKGGRLVSSRSRAAGELTLGPVGASLLAKNARTTRAFWQYALSLTSIASKLAPTGGLQWPEVPAKNRGPNVNDPAREDGGTVDIAFSATPQHIVSTRPRGSAAKCAPRYVFARWRGVGKRQKFPTQFSGCPSEADSIASEGR